jgi:glycosyltransferase involved in cell wall biosynthesis
MNRLSIIMPCFNRADNLIRVLQAYDQQRGEEPFELVAVDDGSQDETYDILASYRPARYTLHPFRMETNQGPAAARNQAIEKAQSPLLLIVGDDIVPAVDLVQGHITAHHIHTQPGTAILGKVTWPDDMPKNTLMAHIDGVGAQQFSYFYLKEGEEYDFRHFYTSNVSIKTEFLKTEPRWFDTDFHYAALEDAELAYRMSKRGLHIVYASHLIGYHYHYHNIWTFSKRQQNSGVMATILLRKHPALNYMFRAQYYRLLHLLKRPKTVIQSLPPETVGWLENSTCRLLSLYEWDARPFLDQFYLAVLDYFYYDGVFLGLFKPGLASRMRSAHARGYLLPALARFLVEAAAQRDPIPEIYAPRLLDRLAQL